MKIKDDPEKEEAGDIQDAKIGNIEPVQVEPVADGHKKSHTIYVEAAIGENQGKV